MSNFMTARVIVWNDTHIMLRNSYGELSRIKRGKVDITVIDALKAGLLCHIHDDRTLTLASDNSYLEELEYGLGVNYEGTENE